MALIVDGDLSDATGDRPGERMTSQDEMTRQYTQQLLGYEMPVLHDRRGVWSTPTEGRVMPGELARTAESNRSRVSQELPAIRSTANRNARYEAIVRSRNSADITVYANYSRQNPLAQTTIQVSNYIGAVEVVGMLSTNEIVVAAEDVAVSRQGRIELSLKFVKFSPRGEILAERIVQFPLTASERAVPADKDFELDPNDSNIIRVPVKQGKAYSVMSVSLPSNSAPRPPQALALKTQPLGPVPVDRLSSGQRAILQRAEDFVAAQWTVSLKNLGQGAQEGCDPPGRQWLRPLFLRGVGPDTVLYGVPYEWNGKSELSAIMARLHSGEIAGNVCCRLRRSPK